MQVMLAIIFLLEVVPAAGAHIDDDGYIGCYEYAKNALQLFVNRSDNSGEVCKGLCFPKNKYAGTQSYRCFCGNNITGIQKVSETLCSFYCPNFGYSFRKCGGPDRWTIYQNSGNETTTIATTIRQAVTTSSVRTIRTTAIGNESTTAATTTTEAVKTSSVRTVQTATTGNTDFPQIAENTSTTTLATTIGTVTTSADRNVHTSTIGTSTSTISLKNLMIIVLCAVVALNISFALGIYWFARKRIRSQQRRMEAGLPMEYIDNDHAAASNSVAVREPNYFSQPNSHRRGEDSTYDDYQAGTYDRLVHAVTRNDALFLSRCYMNGRNVADDGGFYDVAKH